MDFEADTHSLLNEDTDDRFNLSEMNTKILSQILNQNEVEKINQKVNKKSVTMISQSDMKETANIQEEQTKVIKQLLEKNEQLYQENENEANMRVTLFMNIEKIKKKIDKCDTFYNIIKQSVERSMDTKTSIDTTYQELNKKLNLHIIETNLEIKKIQDKNEKILQKLKNEQKKFLDFEKNSLSIQKEKDEEIYKLQVEMTDLKNSMKKQEIDYKKVLQEMHLIISQKEMLLAETKNMEEKNRVYIAELTKQSESLQEQIINLQNMQVEDKISIEQLENSCAELNDLLKKEKEIAEELQRKNNELNIFIQELEQEKTQLANQIIDLESKLLIEIETRANDTNDHQNDLLETRNNITQMTKELDNLTNKLNNSTEQTEFLMEAIKTLGDKNVDLEVNMQRAIIEYETKLALLNEENNILQLQVSAGNEEIENLKIKYTELENKSSSIQKKLRDRYDNVFIEKENLKNNVETLKEEKNEMRKDYNKKLQEIKEESDKKLKEIEIENNNFIQQLKDANQISVNETIVLKETITKLELKMSEISTGKKNVENALSQFVSGQANKDVLQTATSVVSDEIDDDMSKCSVKKKILKFRYCDSSDSSFDAEYPVKKPKYTRKRKLPTSMNLADDQTDDIFDSLRDGSMFKHPEQPMRNTKPSRRTIF